MAMSRRKFQRPLGERRYKKLFLVAAEGVKTEPLYFGVLNTEFSVLRVHCLKGSHRSSPVDVLRRMTQYLEAEGIKPSDEAWLVVDKDGWTEEQLDELYRWSVKQPNFGFALSNPKFEFWLLLHFEEGAGIATSRDCTDRLKRYIPGYEKKVDARLISPTQITDAVRRAKLRDTPPCVEWPRQPGQSTVYRLVERIFAVSDGMPV